MPHQTTAKQLLVSSEFKRLVRRRWLVSMLLTLALFVSYYGFILLIALDRSVLARRIGTATTLGIPIGIGVILIAWCLTAIYVVWANRTYDVEVARLRRLLGN